MDELRFLVWALNLLGKALTMIFQIVGLAFMLAVRILRAILSVIWRGIRALVCWILEKRAERMGQEERETPKA